MKVLASWAWVAVLGTALTLSWWSLDAFARRYGMPAVLAGMVSATFDGSALVAADLATRRAQAADSSAAVRLLMVGAVGLSAWLNFEHGALLHYPVPVQVLFASPPIVAGSLFELQLRALHRERLRELGRVAEPLPRFGFMVWAMHPIAAMRRLRQIADCRLQSVPLDVMDWHGPALERAGGALETASLRPDEPAPASDTASLHAEPIATPVLPRALPHSGAAAKPVPAPTATPSRAPQFGDSDYAKQLHELVAANGGTVPSAREVARQLSIGQDRARRLVAQLAANRA